MSFIRSPRSFFAGRKRHDLPECGTGAGVTRTDDSADALERLVLLAMPALIGAIAFLHAVLAYEDDAATAIID